MTRKKYLLCHSNYMDYHYITYHMILCTGQCQHTPYIYIKRYTWFTKGKALPSLKQIDIASNLTILHFQMRPWELVTAHVPPNKSSITPFLCSGSYHFRPNTDPLHAPMNLNTFCYFRLQFYIMIYPYSIQLCKTHMKSNPTRFFFFWSNPTCLSLLDHMHMVLYFRARAKPT